jgi:hypothetical protein
MKKTRSTSRPVAPGDIIKVNPIGKPTEFYLVCSISESSVPDRVTYVVLGNGRVSKLHNARKYWSNENSVIQLSGSLEHS